MRTSLIDEPRLRGTRQSRVRQVAWPISTNAAVSIATGRRPVSVPLNGLSSATTRPSSAGRGARNWTCFPSGSPPPPGRVAVRAVQQLEPAAVRVHRIQMYRAAARVLPAAEHDAPVVEHVGVEVVALVEGDLADAGAVRVHHVQHEGVLVPVLVLGGELRLALVDQHGLRLALPRGREDDAAVRQVVRRDVVAFLGDDVGGDHAAQHVGGAVVFPDVPGRLLAVHRAGDQRHAHREDELRCRRTSRRCRARSTGRR